MWLFSCGMFFCTAPHRWQRSSLFSQRSACSRSMLSRPLPRSSSITGASSKKKGVVKLFQCFLFFSLSESKSCAQRYITYIYILHFIQ